MQYGLNQRVAPTLDDPPVSRNPPPASFSSLVPLRPDGAGRPVFLIPGVYGVVAEMKPLAQALRCGRPVYGLQPRGCDPASTPDDRIEDMARHNIQEIRTVQPRGPYALAGFSFGGHVAFEMAHQLRAAGEEIELLALIDAPMHRRYLPALARARFRLSRAGRALRRLTAREPGERLPHPWRALRKWQEWRRERHAMAAAMGGALPPLPPRRRAICEANVRAVHLYEPRRYPGRVLFLQAETHSTHWADPVPAWRRWCDRLELHRVPGDHASMLQPPDVAAVAAHLDRCLA